MLMTAAVALCVLATPGRGSLHRPPPNMQPGMWLIRQVVDNPALGPAVESTSQTCITKGMLQLNEIVVPAGSSEPACNVVWTTQTPDLITYETTCAGVDLQSASGSYQFNGTSFSGSSTQQKIGADGTTIITIQSKTEGVRQGDCPDPM